MIEAVRHGLGVAMMSRNVTMIDDGMVDVDIDLPGLPDQHIWLVTHKALRNIPRISAIWDELEKMCSELF